jgi:hypothetical protein
VPLHAEKSQSPAQSLRNQEDTLAESEEPSNTDGPNGHSSRTRETLNCNLPEAHGPDPTRSTPATERHSGSDPATSSLVVAEEDHRLDVIGGAPRLEDVIANQTPQQMPQLL